MPLDALTVLLGAGIVASVAAACACAFHARGTGFEHYLRSQGLAMTAAVLDGAALVWALARSVLMGPGSLAERAAHPFSGLRGALLLWTAIAALALAWSAYRWQRREDAGAGPPPDPWHPLPWTLLFGSAVVAATGLACLVTPDDSPPLVDPWAAVANLLSGIGYGIAMLPFAAGLARLATHRPEWADIALPWTRFAFLAAWLGLAAHGIARERATGTFWDWEPTSTVALLAFLPLVALVHALIYTRKNGSMPTVAVVSSVLLVPAAWLVALTMHTNLWNPTSSTTDGLQAVLDLVRLAPGRTILASLMGSLAAVTAVAAAGRVRGLAPGTAWRRLAVAIAAAFGAFAIVGALVPEKVLSAWLSAARALDGSHPVRGAWLVAAPVVILGVLGASLGRTGPTPVVAPLRERWYTMGYLVFAGMWLLLVTTAAMALLHLAAIEGSQSENLQGLLLGAGVPFLLIMGFALSNKDLGRRISGGLALSAVGTSLVGAAVGSEHARAWWILPALAYALFGAWVKTFRVSDDAEKTPLPLRVAGALLLVGGVLTILQWSAPPRVLPLAPFAANAPFLVPVGIALGVAAATAGVCVLRRTNLRLVVVGSLGLVVGLAWSVVPLFGIASLALVWSQRKAFSEEAGWALGATLAGSRREIRKTAIYLVHVGSVLAVAGYIGAQWGGAVGPAARHVAWGGACVVALGLVAVLLLGGAVFETKRRATTLAENR